jgi:hypothetical protein
MVLVFFFFVCLWGSTSLFVVCCYSKPYPGEEPPKKKWDSTRVSSSDFGEMQL